MVILGYLAAIKTQNGAAMSVDVCLLSLIYIDRDIKNGKFTEKEASELIDYLVMKFYVKMQEFLQ